MNKILLILFLVITNTVFIFGQNKETSIGLVSSIEFNKYDFKTTYVNANYTYSSNTTYSVGIALKHLTQIKIFIETGLSYSTQGFQIDYNSYQYGPLGYNNNTVATLKSNLNISYIRIPIKIGYNVFTFGKIKINPSIGLNTLVQLIKTETVTLSNNSVIDIELVGRDFNEILLELNFDLGFEYKINDFMRLSFAPFISKGLNTLDDNFMNSTKLSYGGYLGLYFIL